MKRIAVLLFVIAIAGQAQSQLDRLTGGFKNGRWWEACSPEERLYYLIGMSDGLSAADTNANIMGKPETPYNALGWLFPPAQFGETRKGLDQFYEDPANAAVPLQSALVIFAEKVKGSTPENLAKRTAAARKAANDALEKAAKGK